MQATYWLRVEWVRLCGVDDDWYRLRITGFNARDKETIQHAAEWTCEACMLPNVRRNSERL